MPAVLLTAAGVLVIFSFELRRIARPLLVAYHFIELMVYVLVFIEFPVTLHVAYGVAWSAACRRSARTCR